MNLLNNRYDKLYKSDKNMYCYKKTEEYPIILLTNPIISSNVMVCFEYSAIQGTRGTIGVRLLYGEEEEVEDKFYQIIRVNIKMELEKNGFKVKEVFESMLDANASKISDYQGLIFVGYSTLWYQKKVFRQVVQGKLP